MAITTKSDDEFIREIENANTPFDNHDFSVKKLGGGMDKIVECGKCGQAYDDPADLRNNGRYCPS